MKKIKIFLIATIVLLGGCEDFLDINQSPNDATEPDIDQLLPGIMYDIGDDFSIGFNNRFTISAINIRCLVEVREIKCRITVRT